MRHYYKNIQIITVLLGVIVFSLGCRSNQIDKNREACQKVFELEIDCAEGDTEKIEHWNAGREEFVSRCQKRLAENDPDTVNWASCAMKSEECSEMLDCQEKVSGLRPMPSEIMRDAEIKAMVEEKKSNDD